MMFDLDFYQGKYFRVAKISKVTKIVEKTDDKGLGLEFEQRPMSEGLAVEKRCEDGCYIVVAFIDWDDQKEECHYRDVCFRTAEEVNSKNINEFKKAVKQAREFVYKANGWSYQDE